MFITNGIASLTLSSSLGGAKTRSLPWILGLDAVYLRGVPLSARASRTCLLCCSTRWSSPLPPVHRHTRTHALTNTHGEGEGGGGAQHHSGACARPLRALQRRRRCTVASRRWAVLRAVIQTGTLTAPYCCTRSAPQMDNSWTSLRIKRVKSCVVMLRDAFHCYLTAGSGFFFSSI